MPQGLRALERRLEDERAREPSYQFGVGSMPDPSRPTGVRALERHVEDANDLFDAIRQGDYGRFRRYSKESYQDFHERIRRRLTEAEKLGERFPSEFRGEASKAMRGIPAQILFDFLRAPVQDEEVFSTLQAYTLFSLKPSVEASLPEPRQQAAARMGLPMIAPREKEAILALPISRQQQKMEQAVALGGLLGLTDDPTKAQEIAAAPSEWFNEKVLDSFVVEKLIQISEAPARGLDWLARQIPGDHQTAGQLLAAPLKDVSPVAHNVVSGTADAIKVFSLDSFVLFGKAVKGAKVARGLGRVGDIEDVNRVLRRIPGGQQVLLDPTSMFQRGVKSAPVQRFIDEYTSLPNSMKTVGAMGRRSEQLGWLVQPRVWERLYVGGNTRADVQRILVEEALSGGVERLPYMSVTTPVRDLGERMAGPAVRSTRLTWGVGFDINHPMLEKYLRRFGDYTFDVRDASGAQRVDDWVTRILKADPKGSKTAAIEKFAQEGLTAMATRAGATASQVQEAVDAVRALHPQSFFAKREGLYGFTTNQSGKLAGIKLPFKQTHLDTTVPVFSYPDLLAFKHELKRAMGKSDRVVGVARKVDELLRGQMLIVRGWLATVALGQRIAVEEAVQLAGHHEFGRDFRAALSQRMLDDFAHVPFVGSPIRARFAKQLGDPEVARDVLLAHQRRQWFDIAGQNVTAEMLEDFKGLGDEIGKINPHRWIATAPTEPAFLPAWYHAINHQTLQDPLDIMLVRHWSDPARNANALGWLGSFEGKKYLRQFKKLRGETDAEKAARILKWHTEDITANLPGPLMQMAQDSLVSGKRIGLRDLDNLRAQGIHPPQVVGPAPLSDLEMAALEPSTARKVEEKIHGASAWFVDRYSRRPGFQAAYTYRTRELEHLNEVARRHGGRQIPAPRIDDLATQYAHREMYRMDNPVERSRADFWVNNLVLFSYAQNNFMKRWIRTFAHNPGYISRLRQIVGAGEDLGFIEKDENGGLVLQVPISAEFYKWVASRQGEEPQTFARLGFRLGFDPTVSGAGLLKSLPYALPGAVVVPPGIPFYASTDVGFAPVVTIPVAALTSTKPKLDWLRNLVLGGYESWEVTDSPQGVIENLMRTVMPSWGQDLARGLLGTDGDRAWASSVREVVAWFDYAEKYDPHDKKTWDLASNVQQAWFVLRSGSRFAFPYALIPAPVNVEEHRERFRELTEEFSYEEAVFKFLDEQHGKGWPMLAGMYQGAATDPRTGTTQRPRFSISPTKFGREFYRDNQGFFDEYPAVAGLFTFRKGAQWDPASWSRARNSGQFSQRDKWEIYAQMNIRAASDEYYGRIVPELKAIEEAGGNPNQISAARKQAIHSLDQLFPGFEAYYNSFSSRAYERKQAQQQLVEAANDERVKNRADVVQLRKFLAEWQMAETASINAGYASLSNQVGTQGVRRYLLQRYNEIQNERYSGVLEQAYMFLYRGILEDLEDED